MNWMLQRGTSYLLKGLERHVGVHHAERVPQLQPQQNAGPLLCRIKEIQRTSNIRILYLVAVCVGGSAGSSAGEPLAARMQPLLGIRSS